MNTETRFVWEPDENALAILADCEDKTLVGQFERDEIEVLWCCLESRCPSGGQTQWKTDASLGGIILPYAENELRKNLMAEVERDLMAEYEGKPA